MRIMDWSSDVCSSDLPKHWLRMASQPLEIGDFVMVAGYPGRTARYALAGAFDDTAQWSYPQVVEHYGAMIDLVEAAGQQDEDIAVKYASAGKGWHNVVKNYQGQMTGLERKSTRLTSSQS